LTRSVDDLLDNSRKRISRVGPSELDQVIDRGGIVIDIRTAQQRATEGPLPGALVVERNVLEWRLDPESPHRLPAVLDHSQQVILVCSEGYASSLAAASLADLGFERAGDLEGGYKAWKRWTHLHSADRVQPHPQPEFSA
jgi:rhodanese-related sulfurtransferase